MHGALHVAKTGLSSQDTQLKVISNNLANVNTVGFKKDRLEFEDLLYQVQRQPGAISGEGAQLPSGLQLGSGVRTIGTQKLFETGDMQVTEEPLDIGINGRGFLQVQMPNGETAYTRNGQLHIDSESRLVTSEGYLIEPAITLPAGMTSLTIATDGSVSAQIAGSPDPVALPQLELADFANPQGLQAIGQNLFIETAASGAPIVGIPGEDGIGIVQQGVLEGSNVNAVEELVNMITTQRAYEMNSKVISTADEMLGYVSQQL